MVDASGMTSLTIPFRASSPSYCRFSWLNSSSVNKGISFSSMISPIGFLRRSAIRFKRRWKAGLKFMVVRILVCIYTDHTTSARRWQERSKDTLTSSYQVWLWCPCPIYVPNMNQTIHKPSLSEEVIKFAVPKQLKAELQMKAMTRNVTLSALLRLVITDYLKNKK